MPTLFVTGGSSLIGQSIIRSLPVDSRIWALEHRQPVASPHPNVQRLSGGLASIQNHAEEIRSADLVLHLAGVKVQRQLPGKAGRRIRTALLPRLPCRQRAAVG